MNMFPPGPAPKVSTSWKIVSRRSSPAWVQSGVGTDGNDDNTDAGAVDTGVLNMADTLEEDQLSSWKLYELLDGSARVCRNTIDAFVTASQSMLAMLRLS